MRQICEPIQGPNCGPIDTLFVAGIAGTAVGGIVVGFIAYWWDVIVKVLRTS